MGLTSWGRLHPCIKGRTHTYIYIYIYIYIMLLNIKKSFKLFLSFLNDRNWLVVINRKKIGVVNQKSKFMEAALPLTGLAW